jgi:hypothetical protein
MPGRRWGSNFRSSQGAAVCSSLLATMRIQLKTEGGIAGLRRKLTIDTDEKTITIGTADRTVGTDELPVEEANKLERLIEAADFFELPATLAPTPGAADYQRYTISVTTPIRSHEARLTDPIENPVYGSW